MDYNAPAGLDNGLGKHMWNIHVLSLTHKRLVVYMKRMEMRLYPRAS